MGGSVAGRVHRDRVPALLALGGAFRRHRGRIELVGEDFAARTRGAAAAIDRLVAAGELRPLLHEPYAVRGESDVDPLLQIDRTAIPWFGVRAAGVHLNGFVGRAGGLHLWIAVRARGKHTYPGHLDNLVAGGSAIGQLPRQTLVRECHEEAGIPPELAARAVAVGSIRYAMQERLSLKVDRLDLFDLELPADFTPRAVDGEVEAFHLWPASRVLASVAGGDLWKPNCALVAIDFLLRHGQLDGSLAPAGRWALWQRLRS